MRAAVAFEFRKLFFGDRQAVELGRETRQVLGNQGVGKVAYLPLHQGMAEAYVLRLGWLLTLRLRLLRKVLLVLLMLLVLLVLLMLLSGGGGCGLLLLLLLLSELELLHGCHLSWCHAAHGHHVLAPGRLLSSQELSLGNLLLHRRHLP